jgi:hypothetical protein
MGGKSSSYSWHEREARACRRPFPFLAKRQIPCHKYATTVRRMQTLLEVQYLVFIPHANVPLLDSISSNRLVPR